MQTSNPEYSPAKLRNLPPWSWIAVAAAYLAAVTVLASALRQHFGFPLDDSWIHQSIARNFAWYRSLGYVAHQRSTGSTSLLWTLILSLNYSLLPKLSPVVFCLLVNSACLLGIGFGILKLARRDGLPLCAAVLVAISPAADGNFVWLAFTGMEHLLFVALSVGAIVLWLPESAEQRPRVRVALAGFMMGLLCMTRPEGIVLAVLLIGSYRLTRRSTAHAVVAAVIAAALAAVPFAVNLITSHTLLPVTFKGRQWMYFAGHAPGLLYREQLIEQWITRPLKVAFLFDGNFLSRIERIGVIAAIFAMLVIAAFETWALFKRRYWGLLILAGWGVVHSLLYLVILPTSGHAGRYQPFLLLLLVPVLTFGLFLAASAVLRQRGATILGVLFLAVIAARSLPLWRQGLRDGIEHIASSHGRMAAYLTSSQIQQPVAVFDIGRIGYDWNGRLVDLGGLTDPSYTDYLVTNRVPEYLKQHGIRLAVLPTDSHQFSSIGQELHLMLNPDVNLRPIHLVCTPYQVWIVSWNLTRNAVQCQELFEITIH